MKILTKEEIEQLVKVAFISGWQEAKYVFSDGTPNGSAYEYRDKQLEVAIKEALRTVGE